MTAPLALINLLSFRVCFVCVCLIRMFYKHSVYVQNTVHIIIILILNDLTIVNSLYPFIAD